MAKSKVTLNKTVKTTSFKVNLDDDQTACIDELKRLLKEHKELQYDYNKYFSEAIIKEARSAIHDIEKLIPPSPSPLPIPTPPTQNSSLFGD